MPADAQRVLELMGMAPVRTIAIGSAADAVAFAERWGYPVVLKAFGPAILHKTDAGAVKLGLATPGAVADAHRDLVSRLGSKMSGILIQPMAPDGVEMFVVGLLDACPEIRELDINPVNVLTQGLAVLDVRIRVAPVPPPARSRKVRY